MAKKSVPKSKLIHNYLDENPNATWKTAQHTLAKHGVKSNYFSLEKGKWKRAKGPAGSAPQGKSGRKRGRPAGSAASRSAAGEERRLVQAAGFAREVGGIEQAKKLLDDLSSIQV
jgi:hypothetical protein